MKTKQEQIEEMGQIICGRCENGICLIDKTSCYGLCEELKAEALYNAEYRKLPEDSVVLSREEICELKCQAEEDFNKAYDLGSKETAEKFAEKLKDKFKGHGILFYDKAQDCHYYRSIGKEIDELLKEYEK